MAGAFFDSNVVLYSASTDLAKAETSDRLIAQGGWASVQVLNEVANVSQRKMRHDWARTRELLDVLDSFLTVVGVDMDIHRCGLDIAQQYRLSIWDAMIVAAALSVECEVLYTEDLHHGLVIDGRLRIANPYR